MHAMIEHKRNTAFELAWPAMATAWGGFDSGLSPTVDAWFKDGAGSWTQMTLTNSPAEIGTTGVYAIGLTAAELDHDYVMVSIFNDQNAFDRMYQFRMHALEIGDLDKARRLIANDRSLDVASGVDTVMDDDGSTPKHTITPAEAVPGTVTQVVADV